MALVFSLLFIDHLEFISNPKLLVAHLRTIMVDNLVIWLGNPLPEINPDPCTESTI
jgi:hypothetical protein